MSTRTKLPQTAPYLTVIASRVPREKAHAHFADVRRAASIRLSYKDGYMVTNEHIAVYRWEEKRWVKQWDIPALTKEDDFPWRQEG